MAHILRLYEVLILWLYHMELAIESRDANFIYEDYGLSKRAASKKASILAAYSSGRVPWLNHFAYDEKETFFFSRFA